jgi:hypothetical protein
MLTFQRLVLAVSTLCLGSVAIAQQPAAGPATAQGFAPVGSILEIMLGIVDPTADFIFESVSVVVTAAGSKETQPRTEDEWLAVRNNALILAEAGNLLKMARPVAPARAIKGVEFEPPGPDDLSPAQIEALLKQNRTPFNNFAQKLTDAALVALRAVDARSVEGLFEAGDVIDQACEGCHMAYWYPPRPAPVAPGRKP